MVKIRAVLNPRVGKTEGRGQLFVTEKINNGKYVKALANLLTILNFH